MSNIMVVWEVCYYYHDRSKLWNTVFSGLKNNFFLLFSLIFLNLLDL